MNLLPFFRNIVLISATHTAFSSSLQAAGDPAADFSPTANPNGVWRYGYAPTLGGAMTLHANNGITTGGLNFWRTNAVGSVPWITHNPTAATIIEGTRVVGSGKLSLHPGAAGQLAQLRFAAPVAGG